MNGNANAADELSRLRFWLSTHVRKVDVRVDQHLAARRPPPVAESEVFAYMLIYWVPMLFRKWMLLILLLP